METLLMKGKPVADAYRESITAKIAASNARGVKVILAIVIVGDDPASHVYKERLVKLVEGLGGEAKLFELPAETTQEEVIGDDQKAEPQPLCDRRDPYDADAEAYRRRGCQLADHRE